MMNTFFKHQICCYLYVFLMAIFFAACQGSKEDVHALQQQVDSLEAVNAAQTNQLKCQQNRIAQLEYSLLNRGEGFCNLCNSITNLNHRLDEKNQTIATLKVLCKSFPMTS